MQATCLVSGERFTIPEAELAYCRLHDVPLPVFSPRERLRELAIRRNRVHLFNHHCAKTGKKILSMVPPESGLSVYDCSVYFSDDWDGLHYGRSYDFKRLFFEQWYELFRVVPTPNLAIVYATIENSDYTNGITGAKNCYLLFASNFNEDCMFSVSVNRSRNVVDSVHVTDSELCYECTDVQKGYNLRYCEHSVNCSDSAFLSNCIGCRNCFCCVNLAHKEFHIFNEALSEEEYKKRMAGMNFSSASVVSELARRFRAFEAEFPVRAYFGLRNVGSSGNVINGTKNCVECFFATESEDVYHSMRVLRSKNCILQLGYGNNAELVYNSSTVGDNSYNIRFSSDCWGSTSDLEYCVSCHNGTANCFACVGLRRQSYCILNKQYAKQEYLELVERIKAHMLSTGEYGRFFPPRLSPYGYNASEAIDYFPLTQSQAMSLGFPWRTEEPVNESCGRSVPDSLAELGEEAQTEIFRCTKSGKGFRLIRAELDFYKAQRISPPQVSPMERIKARLGFYAIPEMFDASCTGCKRGIRAVREQAARNRVLCEECFQAGLE